MASLTLTLPENTKGRDFVVGDIHGAFGLLGQALLAVGFDSATDRLIAVGDLIDRGPQSAECLYYLSQPWFYSIRGNHEDLFMHLTRDGKLDVEGAVHYIPSGTAWMLEETAETLEDIRDAFKNLPVAIEIETPGGLIGFVHGDVPSGMDWNTFKQKLDAHDKTARQTAAVGHQRLRAENKDGIDGVMRVFFGHTTVEGGPRSMGNCFYVDTGAVFKMLDEHNTQDLYMTLVDIQADAEDILKPAPTAVALVRVATVRDDKKPPAAAPGKPPRPPAP